MTPYQRGCRDALVDIAAQLDKLADEYERRAAKTEQSPGFRSGHAGVLLVRDNDLRTESTLRMVSELARSLSQRCPEDPEETPS